MSRPIRSCSDLQAALAPLRTPLLDHPVYARLRGLDDVRDFMSVHVFAVWDFMSLLKALQRELTCVEVPWVPRGHPVARRLVNEIVLAEESDDASGGGEPSSHFEMYRAAMAEAGADASGIDAFLARLRAGDGVRVALEQPAVPPPARAFVAATWNVVERRSLPALAAAFTLGREDVIPAMFTQLVADLSRRHGGRLARLIHYLDRHVDLDGDRHGPMAARMLELLCGEDEAAWAIAHAAAADALRARAALWDGILAAVDAPSTGARWRSAV
ncbi:MAG: DUF3050 domain-containing protein [Myxococcota bacterium]